MCIKHKQRNTKRKTIRARLCKRAAAVKLYKGARNG